MKKSTILWSVLSLTAVFMIVGGVWVASLPLPAKPVTFPPLSKQEIDSMILALKPVKRARPVIAVIGINKATETTDYLLPSGILRRANVADVYNLATEPGPLYLFPALKIAPDATIAEFDGRYPDGADYVIVPAMRQDDDPVVGDWLRKQSVKGAIIVGICAGAKVVADAGLLDGKRATTHWFYLKEMREKHPSIQYVPNRRFVVDGNIATTTGMTASIPMSLFLIEAIAGNSKAREVADSVGVKNWDARHDSGSFQFTRPFALTALVNRLSFWKHEKWGVELSPEIDEVSLALVTDAWSRTYRSKVVTFAKSDAPVRTLNGVRVFPDEVSENGSANQELPKIGQTTPGEALAQTLTGIEDRYGQETSSFVAMQLEYGDPVGQK